jgi:hypothetical protein
VIETMHLGDQHSQKQFGWRGNQNKILIIVRSWNFGLYAALA